jgi:hypothetical protein
VSREDIGAIRILDNYSFIQVRDTAADAIIEALNGMSFRGRVLSVDYARTRKDGSGNGAEDDVGNGAGEEPEEDAGIPDAAFTEEAPPESPQQDYEPPPEENV